MDGAAAALDAQELAQLAHVVADVWPSNDEAAQDQLLAEQEGVDGDEDAAYFAQYASLALHRELLADRARNRAYAECLAQLPLAGKLVLEVGTGTGLLALLAGRAGARVYSCERSDLAWHAHQVVLRNGLGDRVHVTQCRVEELQLGAQVDVLLSEWMGSFLFFEGMLDSVLHARDRWLRPGTGVMVPSRCELFCCPVDASAVLNDVLHWWDSVEGFDFSHIGQVIRDDLLRRPIHNRALPADALLANPASVGAFDLRSICVADVECIESPPLVWRVASARPLHGLCIFFTVDFPTGGTLSTSPAAVPTHWCQELLLLDQWPALEAGDVVHATVVLQRNRYWRRHYAIRVQGRVVRDELEVASFAKLWPHHRMPTERDASTRSLWTGRCLCGRHSWYLNAPPVTAYHCHCTLCRRMHGAAFATYWEVAAGAFHWASTTDDPDTTRYRTSASLARAFCTHCGSVLPCQYDGDARTFVPAGSHDAGPPAQCHIFAASRAPWCRIASEDGLPCHADAPPEWPDVVCISPPDSDTPAASGTFCGRCLCGRVGFSVARPALDAQAPPRHCYCSRCRRARAAAFSTDVHVDVASLRWDPGAEHHVRVFSMPGARSFAQAFCVVCGCKTAAAGVSTAVVPLAALRGQLDRPVQDEQYVQNAAAWWTRRG